MDARGKTMTPDYEAIRRRAKGLLSHDFYREDIMLLLSRLSALEKVVEAARELIDGGGWATGRTLDKLSAALAALDQENR